MKTKIGLFFIVVLMLSSCSDWLYLEPEDGDPQSFLENKGRNTFRTYGMLCFFDGRRNDGTLFRVG